MTTAEDTELYNSLIRMPVTTNQGGVVLMSNDQVKDFTNLITLHTQKAERLAQNKMQVDSALHVEEYHYHRLNDVKIGNASVEELITDSKRRIAHLTNPTEAGEL